MKAIYKFFLLALGVYTYTFSQITEITRLPNQGQSIEYFESAPVAISNNELLVFFATNRSYANPYLHLENDTIYSIRSFNQGITWEEPEFVFEIQKRSSSVYDPYYISSLKTSSNRIVLCWVDRDIGKIALMHSDDNGYSWSDTVQIKGAGNLPSQQYASLYDINLSEINNGKILLTFNQMNGYSAYSRESTDDGASWSTDYFIFPNPLGRIRCMSMLGAGGNKVIAFYESYSDIYKIVSSDGGVSWPHPPVKVFDLWEQIQRPRILKQDNNRLWLVCEILYDSIVNTRHTDIFFSNSTDAGTTWSEQQRFTRYIGYDMNISAVFVNENPFITFTSTRFTNRGQISYAILGETVETFKPPYIINSFAAQDSSEVKKWFVRATITDDEKVISANVKFEDGSTDTLYDDGKHNDGDSADYIYANTISFDYYTPSTTGLINVNKLQLPFNNSGVLADVIASLRNNSLFRATDNSNYSSELVTPLEVTNSSTAKYDDITFLYSGGFGLSGYTNGQLWSNAQATPSRIINYIPGRVGDHPENQGNIIYMIYANDAPFGYSWQRWKDAVNLGADFYDGDGDGIYNPVDKNWNGIWDPNEDMPDLLGDVTSWYVFNDGVPAAQRERFVGIEPQGIEIEQTLFASSKPELENIIFLRYKLTNKGTVADILDSVIFSFWADPDLGDHLDDLVGCDTLLSSFLTYNVAPDAQYGNNPPALFMTLLQGPQAISNNSSLAYNRRGSLLGIDEYYSSKNLDISAFTNYYFSDPGFLGDDEFTFRFKMKGLSWDGTKLDPCTYYGGEVRGGVDCSKVNPFYWYSGDPVNDIGWINVVETDQRTMLSVGEFTLEKDKPVTIIGAYVLGRGTNAINSITVARENVQRAIQEYLSNFSSLTYDPGEPTNPVVNYVLYQNYPNPFNPTTTIRYELPQDGVVTIELFDILGQKVKTMLNEFQNADRYEISFNAVGLASGVYIYRMKVNDFIQSKKMLLIR